MRVGILSEAFDRGGAERQAAIWARMAAELGHEVTGIAIEAPTTGVNLPPMRHVVVDKARPTDMAKIALRLRALQRDLDALVAFEPFLAVCCAAAGLRIPWLVVSGKVPAQLRADSRMPLAAYRWAFDRAALAAAPTRGMIDGYRGARIRPRKDWLLVPNVAEDDAFLERSGSGHGALFVGRLVAVKDPFLAIEAAAAADAPLTVLGEGELREEVDRTIEKLDGAVPIAVKPFTGEPWQEYARHRALIVSSRFEAFGNVIVESLAAGTPVVSVDCDYGPREIISGARYSHLTEPTVDALGSALRTVLDRPYSEPERDECREIAARYAPWALRPRIAEALDLLGDRPSVAR